MWYWISGGDFSSPSTKSLWMNPRESQATVVVRGPEPLEKYSQISDGLSMSRAKLNVTGLFTRKGPKRVVTWSCKFFPTWGLFWMGFIYKRNLHNLSRRIITILYLHSVSKFQFWSKNYKFLKSLKNGQFWFLCQN